MDLALFSFLVISHSRPFCKAPETTLFRDKHYDLDIMLCIVLKKVYIYLRLQLHAMLVPQIHITTLYSFYSVSEEPEAQRSYYNSRLHTLPVKAELG